MTWALLTLAVAAIGAASAAAYAWSKLADARIAEDRAQLAAKAATASASAITAAADAYRRDALATIDTLNGEIKDMERDLEACADPAVRRDRWKRLLSSGSNARAGLDRNPTAGAAADAVLGLVGAQPATAATPGPDAARPG